MSLIRILRNCICIGVGFVVLGGNAATIHTEIVNGIEWTYTVSNGTASVGGGSSSSTAVPKATNGVVEIPSTLGDYSVTRIRENAFYNCYWLTSVTIPDSVTNIGSNAFYWCCGLTNVTIGAGVTSIGNYAFHGCGGLTSVTIPNSVTSIGSHVFDGCYGLTSVTIPESVKSIGNYAFHECRGLTSVTIPESVRSIGNYAFYECRGLTSVTIPESVKSIGNDAFDGCSSLTSVTIPDSVTSIGNDAFYYCGGLTNVTIGNGVTSIGNDAFSFCSGLTSVTIGNSVTSIGSYAFSFCSGLTSVNMPNSVIRIGKGAFERCSGLTSVTIPDSVTSIGDHAFDYCNGLTNIVVGEGNLRYMSVNGLLLSKDGAMLVCGVNGEVTIPDSVTSVADYAFYGCSSLISVTIPDSVTSIGDYAFYGCSSLTNVTIPDSVISLGIYAFYGCSGLAQVTIGRGVKSIKESAFYGCKSLISVTIPDGATSIGKNAFYGCKGLGSVIIPNSVINIGNDAFCECNSITHVLIPQVLCSSSFLTTFVNVYAHIRDIIICDGVKRIEADAFSGCSGLTSVTIPDSVTSIGGHAFDGCSGLTSVTIPNSVIGIGSYAFSGCSGLTSVTIPNSVTSIGDHAFYNCDGLTSVTIGSGVTSIGRYAFYCCSGLISVTIPDSVTSIGSYAFYGCDGLTSATIGNGVTIIGGHAFSFCSGLRNIVVGESNQRYMSINDLLLSRDGKTLVRGVNGEVTIPDSVTTIMDAAFNGCSGLKSVTIGSGVTSIGNDAFSFCSGLMNVTIPDSVTSIGNDVFYYCGGLTNVIIGAGVTSIGNDAFYYCSGLTNVIIGNSVTSVGDHAFGNCSGLTSVTMPNSVTNIGSYAFSGCSGLTSVTIPNSVTSIGNHAFYCCSGLASVTIPDSVTSIGNDAFYYCSGLTNVTIGSGVTSIGNYAFYCCSRIKNMTFYGNMPAFSGAYSLSGIPSDCCVYVRRASSGWGVTIPGRWKGLAIDYICHTVVLDANGGECSEVIIEVKDGLAVENLPTPTRDNAVFLGWFTAVDGGERIDTPLIITNSTTLYTHWITGDLITILKTSLDVGEGVEVATDEVVPWLSVLDSAASVGTVTARSGAIGDREETWLSASVSGAGTMTFWCKTSCEHDEDGAFTWDRLMVFTNDVEVVEWRMDGKTDWTQRTVEFVGGENTVKWVYCKDRIGADGEDCAWVDGVTWTPTVPFDPYEPMDFYNVDTNWFAEHVSGYAVGENLPLHGYELSGRGAVTVEKEGDAAYLAVNMKNGGVASYTPNPTGRNGVLSTIVTRARPDSVVEAISEDELPVFSGQQGGICVAKIGESNAWLGLTMTGWRRLHSDAPPPMKGVWYDIRTDIDNRNAEARKVRYFVKRIADAEFTVLADENNETWLPNASAEPVEKVSQTLTGGKGKVGDFYGSQTPTANVVVNGNGEVALESSTGYVIVATEGRTLEDSDFSFAVAREAYQVEIASDGKSATVKLKPPVIGGGGGGASEMPGGGEAEAADKDESDPSGLLVDAADVVAKFGADAIKAMPTAKEGETTGVMPVKTYAGLYYRVAWGDGLDSLTVGEKVLASGDTLYLGVIKQASDKGFYKIIVSER